MQDSRVHTQRRFIRRKLACQPFLSWMRKPLSHRATQKEIPQRVLMIELFEMGSAVMLAPSITYLKKQNPNVEIHALTTQSCALPFGRPLEASGDFKSSRWVESGTPLKFIFSALKTIIALRRICFDLIVDYELFMRVPAIFSGLLKGKRRGGFFKYDFLRVCTGGIFTNQKCAYNQKLSHLAKLFISYAKTTFENAQKHPKL